MSPERDAFDEYVYRGIDLERYADHIQYRTQGYLEELYDELQGELARINPGEHLRWRDQRLLRLARIVEPLVKKTYGTITDEMSEDMGALAGAEAN